MNKKIRFIRETLKLNYKDISQLLNISVYVFAAYEKEDFDIPFQKLCLISNMFAINVIDLLDLRVTLNDIKNILIDNKMISLPKDKLLNEMMKNISISKRTFNEINRAEQRIVNNTIEILNNLISIYGKEAISKKMKISLFDLDLIIKGTRPLSSKEIKLISYEFFSTIKQGE